MSEQSLDLLLQTVEMYRTGKYVCNDKNVINKSYPDGLCYYSEDNRGKENTDMQIIPSIGSVNSQIKLWDNNKKTWILSSASETNITINHKVGSLKPGNTFQVLLAGKEVGSYQTNQDGEINFSFNGNFKNETEIKLINKN
jgi:hypothetical protein